VRAESLFGSHLRSNGVPLAYGNLGAFCKGLRVHVLANKTRDVSLVTGDVLQGLFMGGPPDPVGSKSTRVAENFNGRLVLANDLSSGILGSRVKAYSVRRSHVH
jgi:hypothetical protein